MILLVTGMPYSGKTTFADFCVKFGVPAVSMGKVVRHEVREMGLSEENILSYARALRLMFGREIVARRTLEMVKQYEGDYSLIVVDGVRSMYEVDYFRRRLKDDVKILAILAGYDYRRKRWESRGRRDDIIELSVRDNIELSWGVGDVIALADYYLVNERTKKYFKEKTYKLLERLIPLYK